MCYSYKVQCLQQIIFLSNVQQPQQVNARRANLNKGFNKVQFSVTPFIILSAFIARQILKRRHYSQSSNFSKHPFEDSQFPPSKQNRRIFTISYEDANRYAPQAKLRQTLEEYNDLVCKAEDRLIRGKIAEKKKGFSKGYRIKTFTSLQSNATSKVGPFLVKFLRDTLKQTLYNAQTQQAEDQSNQLFGLNIQQAKTYKFLNKKEKLRPKLCSEPERSRNLSLQSSVDYPSPDKLMNGVYGGGFNIKAIKRISKNQSVEYPSKEFLNTVLYKKQSLPKRHAHLPSKHKKHSLSTHDLKFARMIACLDIVLNSFHFALEKQADSSVAVHELKSPQAGTKPAQDKFLFYVGKGNNAELVKSIIKKRSWWVETDNPLKANLVWSQLKIKSVIQKQKPIAHDPKSALFFYENDIKDGKSSNLLKNGPKIAPSQYTEPQYEASTQAFSFLFHERQSKRYYLPVAAGEKKVRLQRIAQPQLYHNHFQFNFLIGNKNALFFNLHRYYQFTKRSLWQVVPLTYYLQLDDTRTTQQFQQAFSSSEQQNRLWILKPGENSNRGQRITLARTLSEVQARLSSEKKLIVQQYIKNAFLYNGRKFDIRTYLLALNINGRLKFYFYEEGYIKTSSCLYNLKNLSDRFVHLTNDAVQQHSEKYGKYEEGNKLSYAEFERYLSSKFSRQDYSIYSLHNAMRCIALEVVSSSFHKLNPNRKDYCFELFGLDFLVDASFKPFLIEVNTNPCLQLSSHSLERLIPRMLENMFRLALDTLFRPQFVNNTKAESYYFYDETFLQKNQFRLIFDNKYDTQQEWVAHSENGPSQKQCNFQCEQSEEDRILLGH